VSRGRTRQSSGPGIRDAARQVVAECAAAERIAEADARALAASDPREAARWQEKAMHERRRQIRLFAQDHVRRDAGTALIVRLDRFLAERGKTSARGCSMRSPQTLTLIESPIPPVRARLQRTLAEDG
jgi:hypothetical protein